MNFVAGIVMTVVDLVAGTETAAVDQWHDKDAALVCVNLLTVFETRYGLYSYDAVLSLSLNLYDMSYTCSS